MEITTLFGLPAHPLIVHAAVVLLPLAALLVVIVAVLPRARRIGAPIALGLALVATVAVGLAQGSGEELEESVDETQLLEAHTDAGENVLPWAIFVTAAAAAAVAADPLQKRLDKPSPNVVTGMLAAVALVAGVGATVTVVDVGHSGAESVWHDTLSDAPAQGDGSGARDAEATSDGH